MNAVLVAGRNRREQRRRFAGARYRLPAHLLHSLRQQLSRALIEDKAIHEAKLNPKQEDNQPRQEVLIAVEFHRQPSIPRERQKAIAPLRIRSSRSIEW